VADVISEDVSSRHDVGEPRKRVEGGARMAMMENNIVEIIRWKDVHEN
jgi:hypothetical protein